jgi:hypothetical protein
VPAILDPINFIITYDLSRVLCPTQEEIILLKEGTYTPLQLLNIITGRNSFYSLCAGKEDTGHPILLYDTTLIGGTGSTGATGATGCTGSCFFTVKYQSAEVASKIRAGGEGDGITIGTFDFDFYMIHVSPNNTTTIGSRAGPGAEYNIKYPDGTQTELIDLTVPILPFDINNPDTIVYDLSRVLCPTVDEINYLNSISIPYNILLDMMNQVPVLGIITDTIWVQYSWILQFTFGIPPIRLSSGSICGGSSVTPRGIISYIVPATDDSLLCDGTTTFTGPTGATGCDSHIHFLQLIPVPFGTGRTAGIIRLDEPVYNGTFEFSSYTTVAQGYLHFELLLTGDPNDFRPHLIRRELIHFFPELTLYNYIMMVQVILHLVLTLLRQLKHLK